MKKEEEDARLLDRCEAKRKEWVNHFQCDGSLQNVNDKPWNEELKKLEEALPRLKECELEKVSRLCKAKTGVGCDGFRPKVHRHLTQSNEKRNRGSSWKRWSRVEHGRNKLVQQYSS